MDYQDIKNEIEVFMDTQTFLDLFRGASKDFEVKMKNVMSHIEKLMADETVDTEMERNCKNCGRNLINKMMNVVIEYPLDEESIKFLKNCSLVLYNYVSNVIKGKTYLDKLSAINAMLDSMLTMRQTIDLLRSLNKVMSKWVEFKPPVVALSKMYLESLIQERDKSNSV